MLPRRQNPHSLTADIQPPDQPNDRQKDVRRSTLVTGQLLVDDTWHACAIMNMSDGGARIRMEDPCPVAGRAAMRVRSHGSVPVDIIWQEDETVGLKFAGDRDAVDAFVSSLDLAEASPLELRRHQRCSVLWSSRVFSGGTLIDAIVLNISASGAKAKLLSPAILGERLTLSHERFGDLPARLVWRDDLEFGVEFLDPPEQIANILGNTLPRIHDDLAKATTIK